MNYSDPMPKFTIKAKDNIALEAIRYYAQVCKWMGLFDQAKEVHEAIKEIEAWRERNPDHCKNPNHFHKPVQYAIDERTDKGD